MRYLALLLLLPFLTACGSDSKTDSPPDTLQEITSTKTGGGDCFGPGGVSVCDFLPMDIINRYIPGGEANGYDDTERKMLTSCSVSMEDPKKTRKMTVGTFSMNVPVTYSVGLAGIQTYDDGPASFASQYRTMTESERAEVRARMDKEIAARKASGSLTEEQADLAGGFAKLGASAEYFPLENVGDKAVYGGVRMKQMTETVETIYVLTGNTVFALEVDLAESREHSRQAAAEIARGIVAQCR